MKLESVETHDHLSKDVKFWNSLILEICQSELGIKPYLDLVNMSTKYFTQFFENHVLCQRNGSFSKSFEDLPVEILFYLTSFLNVKDVLSFSQTNKVRNEPSSAL